MMEENVSWSVQNLSYLAEKIDYGHTASADHTIIGPKFLRITDIQNGYVDWYSVPTCKCNEGEQQKYSLRNGDIVFARTGATTGKSYLVTECPDDAIFASYLIRVRPNNQIVPSYLAYFFQTSSYWEQISRNSSGSAQPGVNATKLKNLQVSLPSSLREQKRIVAILDEAFAAIATATANAERNLVNARAVFDSQLNEVFENRENGWDESDLGDLITVKHGFAFKSTWFSNLGDHVLLTPGNFYETGGYRERGDKQKYYTGDIPQDFVLSAGNLLVAMTEQAPGLLGSPLIVPESNRFLHNQRLGLVEPMQGNPWCTEFFFHLFNTKAYRDTIYRDASGVKVRHTSPKKIYNVRVRYPKLISSQQEIARLLENLKSKTLDLSVTYEKKLDLLAELKQAILHKAFTGELTADPQAADRLLAAGGV